MRNYFNFFYLRFVPENHIKKSLILLISTFSCWCSYLSSYGISLFKQMFEKSFHWNLSRFSRF